MRKLIALLPVVLLVSCIGIEEREQLTIAEASQPVFALIYIAESRGYFEDEGLEITFKSFTSGKDALDSVISGESDISTVYETPVVIRTLQGEKLSIISTLHKSQYNTALVGRRDRGISVPSDLKGKRIGVSIGTNGEFFLSWLLAAHGLIPADVTLVDIKPTNMDESLSEGLVDAIASWNPHVYDARESLGEDNAVVIFSDVYTELSVLAGRQDFVSNRPLAMEKLVRSIVRAERFLQDNPKESLEIVIQRLPALPEATIRATWKDFKAEVRLDNVLLALLEGEADWMIEQGNFEGPRPSLREVLITRYLKVVSAESVTVN